MSRMKWLAQEVARLKQTHSVGTKEIFGGLKLKLEYLDILEASKTGLSLQELVALEQMFHEYGNTYMCLKYPELALSLGGQFRLPGNLFNVTTRDTKKRGGFQNVFFVDLAAIASKLQKMPVEDALFDFLEAELALTLDGQRFDIEDINQFITRSVGAAAVDAFTYALETEIILSGRSRRPGKLLWFLDPLANHILSSVNPRVEPEKWLISCHEDAIRALHTNLDPYYYSSILSMALASPWEDCLYTPETLVSRAIRETTLGRLDCSREIAIAAINETKRKGLVELEAEGQQDANAFIVNETIELQRRKIKACEENLNAKDFAALREQQTKLFHLRETLNCLLKNQAFLKRYFGS